MGACYSAKKLEKGAKVRKVDFYMKERAVEEGGDF